MNGRSSGEQSRSAEGVQEPDHRHRRLCRVRATSGHAAAAPPTSDMNSRRFTASDSRASHRKDSTPRHGDCCIHPSERYETIAVTPPIIFSKEVAQNRPPHFLARTSLTTRNSFRADFRGWRLDEFSIFARPPPGGSTHPHPRGWRRRLTPALAAALCRSRCTPSRR